MNIKIIITLLAILTIAAIYFFGGANFAETITAYGAFYSLAYASVVCFRYFKNNYLLRYMSLLSLVPAALAYFLYLSCDPGKLYPHLMATLFNLTEVLMSLFILKIIGICSGAKK